MIHLHKCTCLFVHHDRCCSQVLTCWFLGMDRAKQQTETGRIVNLMSADVNNVMVRCFASKAVYFSKLMHVTLFPLLCCFTLQSMLHKRLTLPHVRAAILLPDVFTGKPGCAALEAFSLTAHATVHAMHAVCYIAISGATCVLQLIVAPCILIAALVLLWFQIRYVFIGADGYFLLL